MTPKYVISNTPTRLPLFQTILIFFLLDYYNSPGWLWGVLITLWSILWIACIVTIYHEERIDLNDDKPSVKRSKFAEKLAKILTERRG